MDDIAAAIIFLALSMGLATCLVGEELRKGEVTAACLAHHSIEQCKAAGICHGCK